MLTNLLMAGALSILLIACETVPVTDRLHQIDTTLLALQETIPTLIETGDITQEDSDRLVSVLAKAREINGRALDLSKIGQAVDAAETTRDVIDILHAVRDEISNESIKQDVGRVIALLTLTRSIIEQEAADETI
jgi:hypothetical protein